MLVLTGRSQVVHSGKGNGGEYRSTGLYKEVDLGMQSVK